jgi:hypothetical protein
MISTEELINNLLEENRMISEEVKAKFSHISFDLLNYRPGKYQWSIAECFDHLIVTKNQYIPRIESELETVKKTNPAGEFKSTMGGRLILYSVNPENRKKTKAPRMYRPEIKLYTKEVIKFFLDQNNRIYKLITDCKGYNISEIKINSPVTRLIKLNLGDCFQIINSHDRRHINQAFRILQSQP